MVVVVVLAGGVVVVVNVIRNTQEHDAGRCYRVNLDRDQRPVLNGGGMYG